MSPFQNKFRELASQFNENFGFIVSCDIPLKIFSPIYKGIAERASSQNIRFEFTPDREGDFKPWSDVVSLGTQYYSSYNGQIRIPFYTYLHEATHLALFKEYYSNIDISNDELNRLLLLIEWFCISLDLLLAKDLISNEALFCLAELNTIPHKHKNSTKSVFLKKCRSLERINKEANDFKQTLLARKENPHIDEWIASKTLQTHRDYCKGVLLPRCRKVQRAASAESARYLIRLLECGDLSEIADCLILGVNKNAKAI